MAPWRGPRHRSWASNTNVTFLAAIAVVATAVAWEVAGTLPDWMVTLVGLAGGALFGAVSDDRKKREAEERKHTEEVVRSADEKADRALRASGDDDHDGDAVPTTAGGGLDD